MVKAENTSGYQCARCAKQFARRMDYNKHQKTHDRPYKCKICLKSFALETDRKRHRKIHQAAHPKIQCPLSPCKFRGTKREDYFWKHLNQRHDSTVLSHDTRPRPYNEAKEKHTLPPTAEQNLRLLEASSQGDYVVVAKLLSGVVNVNTEDNGEKTPLCLAAHAGHEIIVNILLESGAEVNRASEYREASPLMEAVLGGQEDIVRLLVNRGADVKQINLFHSSPLQAAASQGNEAMVKLLIESGADINAGSDYYYGTALHGAITNRHLAVADFLLKNGAEVNPQVRTYRRETDLHVACHRKADLDPAETNDGAIVSLLLQAGADIDAQDDGGCTPLSNAIGHTKKFRSDYFEEGVNLLLGAGARISPKDLEHLPADLRDQYASQLARV